MAWKFIHNMFGFNLRKHLIGLWRYNMMNKGTAYLLVSSENMSQTRGEEVKKNWWAKSGSTLQDHFHIPSSLPGYRRCSSSVFYYTETQTQKYNPDLRFRCLISSCFKVSILPLAMAEVKMYLKLFQCFEFTLSQDVFQLTRVYLSMPFWCWMKQMLN